MSMLLSILGCPAGKTGKKKSMKTKTEIFGYTSDTTFPSGNKVPVAVKSYYELKLVKT